MKLSLKVPEEAFGFGYATLFLGDAPQTTNHILMNGGASFQYGGELKFDKVEFTSDIPGIEPLIVETTLTVVPDSELLRIEFIKEK